MRNVAIVGALWTSNFGDVLLAKMFKEKIESLGYSVSFPNASEEVRRQLGMQDSGKSIWRSNSILFCGGGYFSEPPGNALKWAIIRYKLLFWYASVCRLIGKPYYIVGVGAGPLESVLSKLFIRHICSGAKLIAVRDQRSLDALESLGVCDVKLVADYVLTMDLPQRIPVTEQKKKVGIHLTRSSGAFISSVVETLLTIRNEHEMWYIEDHAGEYEKFLEMYPSVRELIANRIVEYKSVDALLSKIDDMDYIITNKLHVGIVACVFGKRVCSIPYHAKVKRFYEEIGRPELCLDRGCSESEVQQHLLKFLKSDPVRIPDGLIQRSNGINSILTNIYSNDIQNV